MNRTIIALLLFLALALVMPATTYAQEPDELTPPPDTTILWESIPDTISYLSFSIPQCDSCNGDTAIGIPYEDVPFPEMSWDIGAVFSGLIKWLLAGVGNLFRWLLCWMLSIAQYLANILALILNSLLAILNFGVRLLVFMWLHIKQMVMHTGYFFELIRTALWKITQFLTNLDAWLNALADIAWQILVLLGTTLLTLLKIIGNILKILAWIGFVAISFILELHAATSKTSIPAPLQLSSQPHIVGASVVRGMLDALFDSQIGWSLWLYIGMSYVAWGQWLMKFFSKAEE